MTADFKKVSFQNLIDKPKDNDPWQVLQDIHAALTDRQTPPVVLKPYVSPLLVAFDAWVKHGIEVKAFANPEVALGALDITTSLAKIYLPVFKQYAPLRQSREKLERHLATLKPMNAAVPVKINADPKAPQADQVKTVSTRPNKSQQVLATDKFSAEHSNVVDRPRALTHKHIYDPVHNPEPPRPDYSKSPKSSVQPWFIK